jgi:hypothetical protein
MQGSPGITFLRPFGASVVELLQVPGYWPAALAEIEKRSTDLGDDDEQRRNAFADILVAALEAAGQVTKLRQDVLSAQLEGMKGSGVQGHPLG